MKRISIIAILISITVIISCLTGPMQKLDDPAFYQQYGTWKFDKSAKQCFQVSKKALSDMGFNIEKENAKKLSLISNRRLAVSYGQVQATSDTTAFQTSTKIYVKYYIKVEGDSKSCTVKIVKMKLYHNMSEVDEEAKGFAIGRAKDFEKALKQALLDEDF